MRSEAGGKRRGGGAGGRRGGGLARPLCLRRRHHNILGQNRCRCDGETHQTRRLPHPKMDAASRFCNRRFVILGAGLRASGCVGGGGVCGCARCTRGEEGEWEGRTATLSKVLWRAAAENSSSDRPLTLEAAAQQKCFKM